MLAAASRRIGRLTDRMAAHRHLALQLLLEHARQHRRLVQVTCLRQIPGDEVEPPDTAIERGKVGTFGRRRANDLRALSIELQVKDLGARLVRARAPFTCRLMSRLALPLLATAARSSSPSAGRRRG